jgi:hypothetical protein
MTGEEWLRIRFRLYVASLGIAREAIRSQFPEADEATVEGKLRGRIRFGFCADSGCRVSLVDQ